MPRVSNNDFEFNWQFCIRFYTLSIRNADIDTSFIAVILCGFAVSFL